MKAKTKIVSSKAAVAAKAMLLVLAGLAAVYSASFSVRAADRRGEAGALSVIHADDGLVQLKNELQALAADPNYQLRQSTLEKARSSLKMRPLNAQVLAALGIGYAADPKTEGRTSQLMALADKVSRREPVSQMWLIEWASAEGDVPEALRHYHAVLSTNPALGQALYPVLASALDFPEVQAGLHHYLVSKALWFPNFAAFAAYNAKIDGVMGMIGRDYSSLRLEQYTPTNAGIVWRLAEQGRPNEAMAFAQKVFQGFDTQSFSKLEVSPATLDTRMGRLAWTLADGAVANVRFTEPDEVWITLEPQARADVLSRSIMVNSGSGLVLSYALNSEGDSSPASFKWNIGCENSAMTGAAAVPWEHIASIKSDEPNSSVTFPGIRGCSLLRVKLSALGPDGQSATATKLSKLSIKAEAISK